MSSDNGVRRPAAEPEWSPPRRGVRGAGSPAVGEIRTDTVTGQTVVWDGTGWVIDPSPHRDLIQVGQELFFGGGVGDVAQAMGQTVDTVDAWRRRRQGDHPVYLVPEVPAAFLYHEHSMPGFLTMPMDIVPNKTIVLASNGHIWQALTPQDGTVKRWFSLGRAIPEELGFEMIQTPGTVTVVEDPYGAFRGVVRMSQEDLGLLVSYWFSEQAGQGQQLCDSFWEELMVQMHRPAARREALMLIKKTPTRRGRASNRSVDPLTPWALRAGAEKLLGDVTSDMAAGDHGSDAAYLKRVLDIRHRRQQLLDQLGEVDGYLQAIEAILLAQKVDA